MCPTPWLLTNRSNSHRLVVVGNLAIYGINLNILLHVVFILILLFTIKLLHLYFRDKRWFVKDMVACLFGD